jgi:hypothetical protein
LDLLHAEGISSDNKSYSKIQTDLDNLLTRLDVIHPLIDVNEITKFKFEIENLHLTRVIIYKHNKSINIIVNCHVTKIGNAFFVKADDACIEKIKNGYTQRDDLVNKHRQGLIARLFSNLKIKKTRGEEYYNLTKWEDDESTRYNGVVTGGKRTCIIEFDLSRPAPSPSPSMYRNIRKTIGKTMGFGGKTRRSNRRTNGYRRK